MGYNGEDLEKFGSFVMNEAAEKRKNILKEIEDKRKQIMEQKELEFLEDAYTIIQKEIRKVKKEKNELVSGAVMDNKKKLILKREEIIDDIFKSVELKLRNYAGTQEYTAFLVRCVNESLEACGQGEKVIYINHSDMHLAGRIKESIRENAEIKESKEDIIGGVLVLSKSGSKYIDNSLKTRLQHEKEEFLRTSGLIVEI